MQNVFLIGIARISNLPIDAAPHLINNLVDCLLLDALGFPDIDHFIAPLISCLTSQSKDNTVVYSLTNHKIVIVQCIIN